MGRTARWIGAVLASIVLGGAAGAAASWFRTGGWDWLTVVVFGLATAIPVVAISVAWWGREDDGAGEESVEHEWMQRAHAGTFVDILLFTGTLTFLCTILDVPLPRLDVVLWFAMIDALARMALLRRREG